MYIYVDFKIDVDYDEKGDCLFFLIKLCKLGDRIDCLCKIYIFKLRSGWIDLIVNVSFLDIVR